MDLKKVRKKLIGDSDERAVSPVIGVILMVAITVILAAVIAAFVLDMGDDLGNSAPQATYDWSQSGDGTDINVTLEHTGGDRIDGSELVVETDSNTASGSFDIESEWSNEVTAGGSFTVAYVSGVSVNGDDEITSDIGGGSKDVIGIWFDGADPGKDTQKGYAITDSATATDLENVQLIWEADSGDSQIITEYELN